MKSQKSINRWSTYLLILFSHYGYAVFGATSEPPSFMQAAEANTSRLVGMPILRSEAEDRSHLYRTFEITHDRSASVAPDAPIELETNLIPFLSYIENNITKYKKPTAVKRIIGTAGLVIGGIASYTAFPLGGDFATFVLQSMGIESLTTNNVIYVLSGINSIIPSMALNSVATGEQFQSFVSSFYDTDILVADKKIIKALDITAHILGLFSAISSGYVGYMVAGKFGVGRQVIFSGCAYIGCYMFTVLSQKRISRAFLRYVRQHEEDMIKRQKIQQRLLKSIKKIQTIDAVEFDRFYTDFFSLPSDGVHDDASHPTLRKLRNLFNIGEDLPPLVKRSKLNIVGERIVKALGTVIGLAETYVAYALVKDASLMLSSAMGINNTEITSPLSTTIAVLACIPWASLDIEGVTGRFTQMYNFAFNKNERYQNEFVSPRVRKIISRLAIWGGISSAIPPTYLAIQTTEGLPLPLRIIISGATFLCPATVLTEALDTMLAQGWSWYKSFRPESLESKKERLVEVIEQIAKKLEELPSANLTALYNVMVT